jgi:hypothetical protein
MFDRPDLAARIESLKVWIRDRRLVHHKTAPGIHVYNPYDEVFKAARVHLGNIQMSFTDLVAWSKELHDYEELGLHAILISLLPNLKHLDVNWPYHHPKIWTWNEPTERPASEIPNYTCLDVVLGRSSLTSISIGSYCLPLQNFPATSLTTLTLELFFFGDRTDWWESHTPVLPNVHTMSVTLDVQFAIIYRVAAVFQEMDPRFCLWAFLEYGLPGLQRLALDPAKGTEPRLGTIYGRRGEETAPVRIDQDPQDLEYDSRLESLFGDEFWEGLLESIGAVRNGLLHLSLPANWYSSTGQVIKPMPILQGFRKLKILPLPNVAIIGNPHSKDYDPDRHDTHAVTFLPRALETFTVTQANTETCVWLQEGFGSIELLPGLKEVQLHFREDYWAIFPDGFEEAARQAGVRIVAHWKGGTRVV